MKKIVFLFFVALIALAFSACPVPVGPPTPTETPQPSATPSPVPTPVPTTNPVPTPTPVPAPTGLNGPVKAVFFNGSTVKFWDGTNFVTWKSGEAVRASGSSMVVAIGATLYTIDSTGAALANAIIPAASDAIALQPKTASGSGSPAGSVMSRGISGSSQGVESITSGNNVWTFSLVTTEEKQAAGNWSYDDYSHIYKNGVEQLPWFHWGVMEAFVAANGDVLVRDDHLGYYHDLTAPKTYIMSANDGGPIMWQNNGSDPTFFMTDATSDHEYPAGGYFRAPNLPHQWFFVNGTWYATNGMKWTPGVEFVNRGSKLSDFSWGPLPAWENYTVNVSQTWLQHVGEYTGLSYLIDPCSGWLIAFDTAANQYTPVTQLWIGDVNDNNPGYQLAATLKPEIIDGAIYWHKSGTIWKTDIATLTTINFAPEQQIWVMP